MNHHHIARTAGEPYFPTDPELCAKLKNAELKRLSRPLPA
jgi:hypothetical protein